MDKLMKNIINTIIVLILILPIYGCGVNEPTDSPEYRIQNNSDYVVNFTITSAGNEIVRYDSVQNNTSGAYNKIRKGNVSVNVFVYDGKSTTFNDNFDAKNNKRYHISMHDGSVFGTHIISLSVGED
jgi:hypothetical protein